MDFKGWLEYQVCDVYRRYAHDFIVFELIENKT